jgi:redox-sensitive bicupin YhaK (pirin superfamily)
MNMFKKIDFASLGSADYGWLKARYHFSFSNYHDPERMGIGNLLVINDDRIEARKGFAPHSHDNMEIITYVRQGAITHEDSMGNRGVTLAGDVQVMSAGTGIRHSEYNLSDEQCILYQIWILPRERNVVPRWDAKQFPKELLQSHASLPLLVSGFEQDAESGALFIHQHARIYGGALAQGCELHHDTAQQAYVLVSEGVVRIGDVLCEAGDGVHVHNETSITFNAMTQANVLVIEM